MLLYSHVCLIYACCHLCRHFSAVFLQGCRYLPASGPVKWHFLCSVPPSSDFPTHLEEITITIYKRDMWAIGQCSGTRIISLPVQAFYFILTDCEPFFFFSFLFSSLGCGIGYGYLHRIPTRPFEEGKKISFPGNSPSEPISPMKDGFTEVRTHTLLGIIISIRLCVIHCVLPQNVTFTVPLCNPESYGL